MINSIGSNQDYWSSRIKNLFLQSSNSKKPDSSNTADDYSDAVDSIETNLSKTSTESYSVNDHMEMMQGSRPMGPPPSLQTEGISFSDVDTDSDGSLSTDEYESLQSLVNDGDAVSVEDFFAKYDQDSDGEITSDELLDSTTSDTNSMQRMGPPPPPPDSTSFSDIDSDGDGSLSTDEYEELLSQLNDENAISTEEFFSTYDKNGDGEITSDELFSSSTSETDSGQPMAPPPPPSSEINSTEDDSQQDETESDSNDISSYLQNDMTSLILNAIKAYEMNNNAFNYQDESNINSLT